VATLGERWVNRVERNQAAARRRRAVHAAASGWRKGLLALNTVLGGGVLYAVVLVGAWWGWVICGLLLALLAVQWIAFRGQTRSAGG
jgi:hypothetical protein